MMPPHLEIRPPQAWSRLNLWVISHWRSLRFVSFATGLGVFLIVMPAYLREVFWNSFLAHRVLASMLLVFSLLSISLIWAGGQKLDSRVFLFINLKGARPIWLDRLMSGITQIGSWMIALAIALILFITGDRKLAYELILGTLSLWLVVEAVKLFISRQRPFMRLTQTRIIGFPAIGHSFPSGHTSQTFFLATLIAQHFHAGLFLVIPLYAIALLVGITRMYVGAHYPRDVLAGAILGSVWGVLGVIIDGYILNRFF